MYSSRTNGPNRLVVVGLVVLALMIIASYYRGTGKNLIERSQRAVLTVVAPIQTTVNNIVRPFKRASQYTLAVGSATRDNGDLKRENLRLREQVKRFKRYEGENKRLRVLAGFRRESAFKTVAAHVISRSPTSWQSLITIDAGENQRLKTGMPVVTEKGLVGRTVQVSPRAAVIQLLDDRRSGVGIEIVRTAATAIAEGEMDGSMRLRFMADDSDVKQGDKLVTSGVGGLYPRGVPVGTVGKVKTSVYTIEKMIDIEPAVDFARLSDVLIIVNAPAIEAK